MTTLLRWGLFGVLIALLPIAANKISAVTDGSPLPADELLARGELLLVSVGVCAAAIGELFAKDMGSMLNLRLGIGGASLVLILASAVWFAEIASAGRDGDVINTSAVAVGSCVIFAFAALLGACAMIVAEVSRWS